MDPIYLSIRLKETGDRIKNLIKARGYTVRDVQGAMGFENPQAIYKWMAGRTLPSLDNLIILSRILHTKMEDRIIKLFEGLPNLLRVSLEGLTLLECHLLRV